MHLQALQLQKPFPLPAKPDATEEVERFEIVVLGGLTFVADMPLFTVGVRPMLMQGPGGTPGAALKKCQSSQWDGPMHI